MFAKLISMNDSVTTPITYRFSGMKETGAQLYSRLISLFEPSTNKVILNASEAFLQTIDKTPEKVADQLNTIADEHGEAVALAFSVFSATMTDLEHLRDQASQLCDWIDKSAGNLNKTDDIKEDLTQLRDKLRLNVEDSSDAYKVIFPSLSSCLGLGMIYQIAALNFGYEVFGVREKHLDEFHFHNAFRKDDKLEFIDIIDGHDHVDYPHLAVFPWQKNVAYIRALQWTREQQIDSEEPQHYLNAHKLIDSAVKINPSDPSLSYQDAISSLMLGYLSSSYSEAMDSIDNSIGRFLVLKQYFADHPSQFTEPLQVDSSQFLDQAIALRNQKQS